MSGSTGVEDEVGQTSALVAQNLRHVAQVSGQVIQVQGDHEKEWFEETRDKYLAETQFTETTDMQDLDRLLVMELMVYRWTQHIAAGVDYEGFEADEKGLQRDIKLYSAEITKVKDSMGLSKKARDADANRGDFASYLEDLQRRAKAFGIKREQELDKALELLHELFALVDVFERSDKEEREKIGFPDEASIMRWIRDTAKPEFERIDEHFRKNDQSLWIRDM